MGWPARSFSGRRGTYLQTLHGDPCFVAFVRYSQKARLGSKKEIRRLGGARDRQPPVKTIVNGTRVIGWRTAGNRRTSDLSLNQRALSSFLYTRRSSLDLSIQASPELTEVGRGRSVNLASVGPALQAAR